MISDIKRVGRATFLCSDDDGNLTIRKEEPPPPGRARALLRRLSGGSVPYQNEVAFNRMMAEVGFSGLRYPRLLHSDQKGSWYEYLDGMEVRQYSDEARQAFLVGLFSFGQLVPPRHSRFVSRMLFAILDTPLVITVRRILRSDLEWACKLRAVKTILSMCYGLPRIPVVLLHNDLVIGNVMTLQGGEPALIDFEHVILDRHFTLADHIDLTFNAVRGRLDLAALRAAAEKWSRASGTAVAGVDLNRIWLALARNCAHKMVSPKMSSEQKNSVKEFFVHVLLDRGAYEKWIEQQ